MGDRRKELVLHVGLPRTATTTLQRQFFCHLDNYSLRAKQLVRDLWRNHQDGEALNDSNPQLIELRKRLRRAGKLVVSDEFLSAWPLDRYFRKTSWPTQNSGFRIRLRPDPLALFLASLGSALHDTKISVIMTLRLQSDYCESLAAQVGDMGFRASWPLRLLVHQDLALQYHSRVVALTDVVGRENLLVLFFEDGVTENTQRITSFLNPQNYRLPSRTSYEHYNSGRKSNGKRIGPSPPSSVILKLRKFSRAQRTPIHSLISVLLGFLGPFGSSHPKERNLVLPAFWSTAMRFRYRKSNRKLLALLEPKQEISHTVRSLYTADFSQAGSTRTQYS